MSSSLGISPDAILDQLQSDAPESPLVGRLRNSLSLSDEAASPAAAAHVSRPSAVLKTSSATVSSTRTKREASANSEGTPSAACEVVAEGTRVKTHSHRPISADFLASSPVPASGGLQGRDPAENSVRVGGEEASLEINNKSSGNGLESFVLVHNVAKRHNLGTIARSATAFGVSELILVGRKDFNAFGSHGASLHVQFRHFHTLPEAALYLKAKDVDICGVEIVDGATAVHKHPFTRSTAFVLGNEGTGLSKKEMDICSFFVYIPQCGSGTASLNVTVAASIVLHHFSVWARFAEREREGQKFLVAERPMRRTPRNSVEDSDAVKDRRRQKADYVSDDWLVCDGVDEKEFEDATEKGEAFKVEFPSGEKSGFVSTLNSLYG